MAPSPIPLPRRVAIVSYRLGGPDGVSEEAAKWERAFRELGADVTTVAGAGRADVLVPELSAGAGRAPSPADLSAAIGATDLVVIENCCSLPLNEHVGPVLARLRAGLPTVLRHHDLPWQRPQFREAAAPPDDAAWWQVTINERSRLELAARGISAVTLYNCFDPDVVAGDRCATRRELGVGEGDVLVLQPTRAIPRKNVAGGLLFARSLGATYWLLGPAEDGYEPDLQHLLDRAGVPFVLALPPGRSIADAYAACDVVVLPSTFEGFGNATVESALHRKPLAVGSYPVATELRRFGFSWFDAGDPAGAAAQAARFLASPDGRLLDRNEQVARERFSTRSLAGRLQALLTGVVTGA